MDISYRPARPEDLEEGGARLPSRRGNELRVRHGGAGGAGAAIDRVFRSSARQIARPSCGVAEKRRRDRRLRFSAG